MLNNLIFSFYLIFINFYSLVFRLHPVFDGSAPLYQETRLSIL